MDLIQAIILGVVEGITEFLPISSTGHLVLTENLLGIAQTDFVKSFSIAIQLGAILSVVALYWRKVLGSYSLLKHITVAFIPTALVGFFLYSFIKHYLLGNPELTVATLFFGGILLIGVELLFKAPKNATGKSDDRDIMTYEKAVIIGFFQSISVVPGVSRAASTIIGGMLVGLSRKTATEFSFLLAVPTMFAATAFDLKEANFAFAANEWTALAAGFITSFIVALIAIKWLVKYVQNHTFIPFGIYRIVLSILYFLFILR